MERNRAITITIHSLAWVVYIALPLFILPRPSEFLHSNRIYLLLYFVISILTIAFFYFNYSLVAPKLYFRQKYLLYALSIVGFLLVTALVTRTIIIFNIASLQEAEYGRMGLSGNFLSRFFLIFIVSLGLRYRERMKQLESDRIKAELAALKSQVNPHFLFNTLNGIYGQAITGSDQTASSISMLSSMMRYVLSEASKEKVSLEDEIKYIRSFVHLQKMRLTENTRVIFDVKGETSSLQIPPLLFINFIENAFQYGVSNETWSTIRIEISVDEAGLSLDVSNQKMDRLNNNSQSSSIGIENTRRRLDLIYGDKYSLDITDDEKLFLVNLQIFDP